MAFTTGPIELDHKLKAHENINIVDVRAEDDYSRGHIPGAINLPKDKWDTAEGLTRDKTNILYCYNQTCHLAAAAACEFAAKGFPVMEMDGGFEAWREHDLDLEKGQTSGRMFSLKH